MFVACVEGTAAETHLRKLLEAREGVKGAELRAATGTATQAYVSHVLLGCVLVRVRMLVKERRSLHACNEGGGNGHIHVGISCRVSSRMN